MLYCQKLSANITGVPVWCAGTDGHQGPCIWPTNIPVDGNLRTTLPNDYNFRIDPVTGQASLEQLRGS
jgi:hypothetical protein